MVHPLQIMDFNDTESRELTIRSIRHWLTVDEGRQVYGWSRAAAASLYAMLAEGDSAIAQIHGHMADKRFVRPNTMYIEGSPVNECSIILGRSLQDMLLQSHNNLIRIFPAVPTHWDDAVFHDFLAEGAFLVSAVRKNGVTQWVRIKSLAGEPCSVNPGLSGEVSATVPLKNQGNGIYELNLQVGGEALLFTGSKPPSAVIEPIAVDPAQVNFWGVKENIGK
jgi:hypothetical protein